MPERLVHWSDDPVGALELVEQRPDMKPRGLWVSVGDAWRDWCDCEGFRDCDSQLEYEVTLADDARVLWLSTEDEVREFSRDYGVPIAPECTATQVDWSRVAGRWQGVVVDPYRRMWGDVTMLWHCGWDCSSGCVWDPAAIGEMRCLT